MRLKVIVPVVLNQEVFKEEEILAGYRSVSRVDVELDIVSLDQGPSSIEGEYDEALSQPGVLEKIREAEEQSFDGCLIDCFGDPALRAAREVTRIPVVGAGQAGMFLAASISWQFSIVTVLERTIPLIKNNATIYGLSSKLSSVRAVNIPVLDLRRDINRLTESLVEQGTWAVEEDGADAIVLGCTGMAGLAEVVTEELRGKGLKVSVVDPVKAAVKLAESLVDLELGHAERSTR